MAVSFDSGHWYEIDTLEDLREARIDVPAHRLRRRRQRAKVCCRNHNPSNSTLNPISLQKAFIN